MLPWLILGFLVVTAGPPSVPPRTPPQSTPEQTPPGDSTGQVIVDAVAVGVSLVEAFKKLMAK